MIIIIYIRIVFSNDVDENIYIYINNMIQEILYFD